MSWLEYQKANGYVVAIHEEKPGQVQEGYGQIESMDYSPGDEFERFIRVNTDQEGQVTGLISIRQGPPVQHVLEKMANLEKRLAALEGKEAG